MVKRKGPKRQIMIYKNYTEKWILDWATNKPQQVGVNSGIPEKRKQFQLH